MTPIMLVNRAKTAIQFHSQNGLDGRDIDKLDNIWHNIKSLTIGDIEDNDIPITEIQLILFQLESLVFRR